MATPEIVPFGKYKGQPIEALAQDEKYCEWLVGQEWFRARYTSIHTLIINHFGAPAETPEHNALQALFLDEAWVLAFVVAVLGGTAEVARRFGEDKQFRIQHLREKLERVRGGDSYFARHGILSLDKWISDAEAQERAEKLLISNIEKLEAKQWQAELSIRHLKFESAGADVSFDVNAYWASLSARGLTTDWRVECKPSLGDDYPAVLRQMVRHQSDVLLLGEGGYNGRGALLEQVEKIFALSHIHVIGVTDVNTQLTWLRDGSAKQGRL